MSSELLRALRTTLQRPKAQGSGEWRSLCPFPACANHQQARHTSFTFNEDGPYYCHRCGEKGHVHELPKKLPHLGLPLPSKHQTQAVDPYDHYLQVRGVRRATLEAYGVEFHGGQPRFPYPSGAAKQRTKEGGSYWIGEEEAQRKAPGLFGVEQTKTSGSSQLFIVEGESDTLAFAEGGVSAVSLPHGAGSVPDHALEALKDLPFDNFIILYDNDGAGLKGGDKLHKAMEAQGLKVTRLAYPDSNVTAYDGVMLWNEVERKPEAFQEVLENLPEAPPIPEEWPEIVHGLSATPTPLPLDALTPVLRNVVKSVAASLQVPVDFVAGLALAAVSGAVGGKFHIKVRDSWLREWSVLYVVGILKSGERKSPVFSIMTLPIQEWVAREVERQEASIRLADENLQIEIKRTTKLRDLVAFGEKSTKNKPGRSEKDLRDELEQSILDEIKARKAIPRSRSFLVGDITSEKLVERAYDTGGRVSQFAPEGIVLRLIDGKYKDGTSDAEFHKMAYDGEPYQRDRVNKDTRSITVDSPALTLCCAVQPEVLTDLKNVKTLKAEGVLARFMFIQPPSLVGTRESRKQKPLDDDAYLAYEMALQRLLEVDDGELREVTFTPEAQEEITDFVDKVEQNLNLLRSYASMPAAALKFAGRAARIAALQTMIARALEAESDEAIFAPIEVAAVREAIRLVEALATHTRYTLGVMEADRRTKLLQDVLDRTHRLFRDGEDVTKRNLHYAMKHKFPTIADLEPYVDDLEKRGYLKVKPVPSTGGRPPSPQLLINPLVLQDTSNTSPAEQTSVTSVTDSEDDYEQIERRSIQSEDDDDGLPF